MREEASEAELVAGLPVDFIPDEVEVAELVVVSEETEPLLAMELSQAVRIKTDETIKKNVFFIKGPSPNLDFIYIKYNPAVAENLEKSVRLS